MVLTRGKTESQIRRERDREWSTMLRIALAGDPVKIGKISRPEHLEGISLNVGHRTGEGIKLLYFFVCPECSAEVEQLDVLSEAETVACVKCKWRGHSIGNG